MAVIRSSMVLRRAVSRRPHQIHTVMSTLLKQRTPTRSYSTPITALKIDQDRLMSDIHYTCRFGTGERWGDKETETGMSRLSLSDADVQAREWFAETCHTLGCSLTVDEMGNQFAVRKGKNDGAPTYAGSHLDTQPTGGRYDGILGVTAGVAMLKTLHDHQFETQYPVGVVNWTNEEGARFPRSMVSSGVWAGQIPLEEAHNLASVVRGENATMKSELDRIGFLGRTPCNHEATPMAAHFELHIEQGPLLEKHKQKIGIVHGVQSYKWFTIEVKGRDAHTGSTDISSRADALLAASKMIVASREAAFQRGGLASTGIIQAMPGSTNTIPGTVRFSLDIRAKSDEIVDDIEERLEDEFDAIANGRTAIYASEDAPRDNVSVKWTLDQRSPAINFHPKCITCVEEAAQDLFGSKAKQLTRPMVSGAGHDSVYTSKIVPTTMIFVPSRDGVSHNPREYTSPEDCATGAQTLMSSILRFDAKRA